MWVERDERGSEMQPSRRAVTGQQQQRIQLTEETRVGRHPQTSTLSDGEDQIHIESACLGALHGLWQHIYKGPNLISVRYKSFQQMRRLCDNISVAAAV